MSSESNIMVQFESVSQCQRHLIQHVLTPQESHAWYLVWDEQDDVLAPDSVGLDACYRLREQIGTPSPDPQTVKLQMRYQQAIAAAIQASQRLQWTATAAGKQVGIDPRGVYYVIRQTADGAKAITGFIPGFGTSDATVASQRQPENPHARVQAPSRMRRDEGASRKNRQPAVGQRARERRAEDWTLAQRQYHLVFRRAVQFVRGYQDWQATHRPDMSDLKSVLPRMSQLRWQDWQTLFNTTGRMV